VKPRFSRPPRGGLFHWLAGCPPRSSAGCPPSVTSVVNQGEGAKVGAKVGATHLLAKRRRGIGATHEVDRPHGLMRSLGRQSAACKESSSRLSQQTGWPYLPLLLVKSTIEFTAPSTDASNQHHSQNLCVFAALRAARTCGDRNRLKPRRHEEEKRCQKHPDAEPGQPAIRSDESSFAAVAEIGWSLL